MKRLCMFSFLVGLALSFGDLKAGNFKDDVDSAYNALVDNDKVTLMKLLSKYKEDKNFINTKHKSEGDKTLLHFAVQGKASVIDLQDFSIKDKIINSNMGKILLNDPNIDINIQDDNGETPLHLAVNAENKEMVQRLLGKGANTTIKGGMFTDITPLELAGFKKNSEIITLLKNYKNPIEKKVDFSLDFFEYNLEEEIEKFAADMQINKFAQALANIAG